MHGIASIVALALAGVVIAAPQGTQSTTVNGVSAVFSTSKPSADGVMVDSASGYRCASGEYLTYGIKTAGVPNTNLRKCQAALANWASVAPGTLINSNGSGSVGATRVWQTTDGSLGETTSNFETLTTVNAPSSGNSNLEQGWTAGHETYYNGGLTLYQGWHDLTVQGPSDGSVQLQYYINTCASDQSKAYQVLSTVLKDAVSYWIGQCQQ